VWQFLKKLNIKLSYPPSIPFLAIPTKGLKAETLIGPCMPMFIALFTIAKRWKQSKGSHR